MQLLIDTLTMSSREIAELTGKRHGDVIRDTRAMLDALGDDADLRHVQEAKDGRGYTASISLPKDLTLTLVAGYNVKLRKRIIDRWLELEDAARKPPAIPNLPDADMLNALLVMYLQRVLQNGVGLAAMPQLPPSTISADKLAGNVIQHREGERLHGVRRRVLLSPAEWEIILDMVERGEESMAQLAREYGIANSTISRRLSMRRQARLGPPPAQPKPEVIAADPDGGFSITAAAKALAVSPSYLFRWLADHRWIYRRSPGSPWSGYQDKLDSGLMRHRQFAITHNDGRTTSTDQVLVTPKGMARLVKDVVVQ